MLLNAFLGDLRLSIFTMRLRVEISCTPVSGLKTVMMKIGRHTFDLGLQTHAIHRESYMS